MKRLMGLRGFWLAACCAAPGLAAAQPYVTAQVGYASADFAVGAPFNGVIDDNSFTYGVDVGWGFGNRWAFEAGLSGYGGFDGRGTPCDPGAVCPLIVTDIEDNDAYMYRFALAPRFTIGPVRLFAKAGYYRLRVDTEAVLADDEFTESGLLLGAGVRLYVRDPWHVSLEVQRLDSNVTQASIGFGWGLRFGED